jgi:hypothetical protein
MSQRGVTTADVVVVKKVVGVGESKLQLSVRSSRAREKIVGSRQ